MNKTTDLALLVDPNTPTSKAAQKEQVDEPICFVTFEAPN